MKGGAACLSAVRLGVATPCPSACRRPRLRQGPRLLLALASAQPAEPRGQLTNVLVVGGGGREHALCWRLRRSESCGSLFCAPGNAGVQAEPGVTTLARAELDVEDHAAVTSFCAEHGVRLVVVGPEAPLVAGLADSLRAAGVLVFGPSAAAAQLEGSKVFMKGLLARHAIPTASYAVFRDPASAKAHIAQQGAPIVVKADGLAAGKGVVVAMSEAEAAAAVDDMLVRRSFGDAGASVVLEEFLEGEEASFFALVGADGVAVPLAACQDHKAVGEGDTGPNTGGMGAYSPAPVLTAAMQEEVMRRCVQPTVDAMAAEGCPFSGVLFAGLMISPAGEPRLLEYNVRFGDPECQALMARMTGDLAALLLGASAGETALAAQRHLRFSDNAACCVVVAARGYPGSYASGERIEGVEAAEATGAKVFHAGTRRDEAGALVSAGGRVLGVTGVGPSMRAAAKAAYAGVDALRWPGGFVRRDIGYRAIRRETDKEGAVAE